MADRCKATQHSIDRQGDMFRLAERDHGLTLTVLSRRTEIPAPTLKTWRDGTVMPAWALFKLGGEGGIHDDLLSMIGEPFRRAVVSEDAAQEGLIDDLAESAARFTQAAALARHPNGPGGTAIVPQERAALIDIARDMRAVAAKVIGE
ncbi:hypothetical protein [Novosphingobium humi]|uniref:Bacteriophage CI repressor helix-turn-helix domain-containing protein n=1 Tax=Novosphingobium humi TaxID=2282397 RepID=A0ABY7U073_9SPHN|nr:hypothetical protein [Novosphingobium humi]WCT78898.1 hypothetical protein PQ457_08050 [Novosphingobium humi]